MSPQLSWHDYFLNLAMTTSRKSKDPSTKCGAVLVDQSNRIISLGYNGFPKGVPDLPELLANREKRLALTIHAEENAMLFAKQDLEGATCYVWPMPPCGERCAPRLAQAGIKQIVTCSPTAEQIMRWGDSWELAAWVYSHVGIEVVYHWSNQ